MQRSCSHILISVANLHTAVRDFRELGFEVEYATAEAKAQHAHIWFRSGPILELLTAPAHARWFKWPIELFAGRGAGRRMTRWAEQSEGFCDVATVVHTSNLAEERNALRRAGIEAGRVINWKRVKPDGRSTRFQFAYPRHDRLPFMVTPYDPPQHPADLVHANGATALVRVHLAVRREDRAAVQRIVGDDQYFELHEGEVTAVREVELAGLHHALDPAKLHGANIVGARPPGAAREVARYV